MLVFMLISLISADGTAGFSGEAKDAAANLIWPIISDQVMTTTEWIKSLAGKE
jgi:hypothetical protein